MKKLIYLILMLLIAGCSVTKNTKTLHPFSGDSIGCGNFTVFKLTEDNMEYVAVTVDIPSIELISKQAYGIGKTDLVKVVRKKYDGAINETLCNDIMPASFPKEMLMETAEEGLVEVIVTKADQEKAANNQPYKATVVLRNVVFETVSIDYLRFENINVGWLPG